MAPRRVCVITSGGKRVCGRPTTVRPSGAVRAPFADFSAFADAKLELMELGIRTDEEVRGPVFALGAYLVDAQGRGQKITIARNSPSPGPSDRPVAREVRTHPYVVGIQTWAPPNGPGHAQIVSVQRFRTFAEASATALRLARAWKLGRGPALRARPVDPEYRLPLPEGRKTRPSGKVRDTVLTETGRPNWYVGTSVRLGGAVIVKKQGPRWVFFARDSETVTVGITPDAGMHRSARDYTDTTAMCSAARSAPKEYKTTYGGLQFALKRCA